MFGAGLHKAGLSDLGGLGPRKLAGCRHPSAGELPDTWGSIFSVPPLGALPTTCCKPILQTCTKSPAGFVP